MTQTRTRTEPAAAEARSPVATYGYLVAARIRSDWQYRGSFFLFLVSSAVIAGLDLAVILVVFGQITSLAGWSRDEVILLYAMSGTSFGLADLFISQVERASEHIKAGTFDQFLIRPVGVLWQLSAHEFAFRRVGRTVFPCILLPITLSQLSIDWTPLKVVLIPATLVFGTFIYGGIWVTTSSIAFWTVDSQEIASSFTYGGNLLTQYPLEVMAPWLQKVATFIVPLAFVCYFPCAYLLGKDQPAGLPTWFAFLTPLVAAVTCLVARALWRKALRHYRSTGS